MIMKKKGLGFWMLTALVVGNMIGSGIFLLPASLAPFGTISLLSWLITGIGSIFLALVFVDLSKMLPKSGGPYVYCHEGFGDFMGFLIAYNYWIGVWVANAAVAVALVGYMGVFLPDLNEKATAIYNPHLSFAIKVGAVWLFTLINILGVRTAGFVQVITAILKTLPLIVISLLGIFKINWNYLTEFNTSGLSNFAALNGAATLTLWAFIGLESATIPAEDANNPRDIPRATIFGTLLTLAIYFLSTVVIMGLIPATELKNSQAPFADAAAIIFGNKAELLIAISAVISCLGALNGWILIQGQIPMAAAKDKLFPPIFAKLSRFNTPTAGLVISSTLVTLLLALTLKASLVKQFTFIVLLATLAYLIPYFISAVAELLILLKNPAQFNRRQLTKSVIISILGGSYAFWAICGAGMETVFYGILLLFSGFPVYAWLKWSLSKNNSLTYD